MSCSWPWKQLHAAKDEEELQKEVRDRLEQALRSAQGIPRFRQIDPTSRKTIPITAMALISSNRVITGGEDGMFRVWDLAKPENLPTPIAAHDGPIRTLVLSPDRHLLASSGLDGTVRVWRVDEISGIAGCLQAVTSQHTKGKRVPLQWRDNQGLVSGDSDGKVRSWDLQAGVPIPEDLESGEIQAFTLIQNDPLQLCTASPKGTVKSSLCLWSRTPDGNLRRRCTLRTAIGESLA